MITRPSTVKGFTLIELAVVLFILALLLGGLLGPLAVQVERKERDETRAAMELALEAIYGFALANRRLPCPDSSGDGAEDCGGSPMTVVGNIPWQTLGVEGVDAWGRPFIYRVTEAFADGTDGTGCGTATSGVSFELCSDGDIRIDDQAGSGAPYIAENIPAIVVSVGKERPTSAEASTDEKENLDGDADFVSRDYATDFDDLVLWISPNVLRNRMVTAGRLP